MLFLLFPQTLTQGVIHNMNDSSGESTVYKGLHRVTV